MAADYQKELDLLISSLDHTPTLLLHACCAPCSSYCLEYLSQFFRITVFFYNPNIYPEEEYFHRVAEQKRLIEKIEDFDDEYVYDLEVEDGSHTFFANNILVHNSIYVRMDNILKLLFKTTKIDWYNKETFTKIKSFVDTKFQNALNNHVADFICNTFKTDQRRIEFKREKISSEGEYLAKKRYVCHVRDNEGLECDKFSYTGVDIAKNELPDTIKKLLKDCVEGMMKFDWDNSIFQKKIMEIYDIYSNLPIKDTAYIKNLNTPKESIGFLKI